MAKERAARTTTRGTRTQKLDLRLTPDAKRKLRAAAEVTNRSVSDFVLESALSRAEEALANRHHFGLDTKRWNEFMKALDAPTRELPRAKRLLTTPGPFDRK